MALLVCRHCAVPVVSDGVGGWRHETGLVGYVLDDGFLPTQASPSRAALAEALARDELILESFADLHAVRAAHRERKS